jgi:hypothetical protein
MTDEEPSQINFPVAVEKMLIETTAMLRVILHNDSVILNRLKTGDDIATIQEISDKPDL